MKKTKLFLLLPLLLASCQKTKDSSSFLPSAPTTPEKRLIVNAPGREDEVYQSVSGDESAPSHPIIQGLLFDGWYTQRVGGDRFDFNTSRAVPDNLYAHWIDFSNKTDAEYLEAFVSLLTDLSGTVNHLVGESSFSIAYAIAGKTFSGENGFVTDRYEDNFVQTKIYSPYYAENDHQVRDEDKGRTAEEVNKKNYFSLIEESYTDETLYSITQYNKGFESYDFTNKDGYSKSKVSAETAASYLDISFASYFLGNPNKLLKSRKDGHEFYKATEDSEDQDKEGDFYYFRNVDPTIIDPWSKTGTSFKIGFAISNSSNDYLRTDYYTCDAGIAFKDGKIAHCTIEKVTAQLLNNEIQVAAQEQDFYDFYQGGYSNRKYSGTKLNYKDFDEYTD